MSQCLKLGALKKCMQNTFLKVLVPKTWSLEFELGLTKIKTKLGLHFSPLVFCNNMIRITLMKSSISMIYFCRHIYSL